MWSNKNKKIILYIVAVLILVVLFAFMIKGCTENIVDQIADIFELNSDNYNTVVEQYVSPDKKYIAYYFTRSINATTANSYQLSIYKHGTELDNNAGNIFGSYNPFKFKWNNDGNCVIIYKKGEQNFNQQKNYEDINITYI